MGRNICLTTDGEDYTGIAMDLTFNQNTSRTCADVLITNDIVTEGPENITVAITAGDVDVILKPQTGVIIIIDDDGMI